MASLAYLLALPNATVALSWVTRHMFGVIWAPNRSTQLGAVHLCTCLPVVESTSLKMISWHFCSFRLFGPELEVPTQKGHFPNNRHQFFAAVATEAAVNRCPPCSPPRTELQLKLAYSCLVARWCGAMVSGPHSRWTADTPVLTRHQIPRSPLPPHPSHLCSQSLR